jgi:hypothetical protein
VGVEPQRAAKPLVHLNQARLAGRDRRQGFAACALGSQGTRAKRKPWHRLCLSLGEVRCRRGPLHAGLRTTASLLLIRLSCGLGQAAVPERPLSGAIDQ